MLFRVLQARRPRLGWPMLIGLLAASACFPLAVYAAKWVPGSGILVVLALTGGAFASWLAGRRFPDRIVWFLGLVAGGMATFAVVGETVPSIALLFHAFGWFEPAAADAGLLSRVLHTAQVTVNVVWIYGREAALRSLTFGAQLARWIQIAVSGGTSQDNDVFLFLVGWLSWAVAFHLVAAFARKRHPVPALAPLALAVTVAEAADGRGDGWLYAFLVLGTLLWSVGTYLHAQRGWSRERIDYSPEIGLDAAVVGSLLAILVTGSAFAVAAGVPRAVSVLRRPLAGPTQQASDTLDRLFGGVQRPVSGGAGWGQADFTDLPLTRVLAGPPELQNTPMLRVSVPGAEEVNIRPLYWRGLTYDEYTGRGWANSASETRRRPPQPREATYLGPELTQRIEVLAGSDPVRYAAAQPVRVNVGATWVTRDHDDLVGWYADAQQYVAVSRPMMASVEALRNASKDYPAWVVERYLQLPTDLPERVRVRARAMVGNAATAYEKAAAIEAAMRAIAYSLEVSPPPPDRDVVDYFLFDMDAGYCDYFATTMTVLARAVGVPARLATGYATGTYDPEAGAFMATGLDAHAWVEVYFPEIGWVPFEPTPARAVIDRSPALTGSSQDSRRAFGLPVGQVALRWSLLVVSGLILAGALGAWVVRRRQADALTPEDQVRVAYDSMWRQAGWFGWGGRASQTPWERVQALERALAERSLQVRLGGRHLTWRGADAVEDLRRLGALFVKAQYSRQGLTWAEAQAAREAWNRVRWRLPLLWHGP